MHPLSLLHLTTGYGRHAVGTDLCATLHRGEMVCLLGPNGAGKSTLLRTLCGFQPPLAGRIEIDGRDAATLTRTERARRIGVVLTERVDAAGLTGRDIVDLGRTPHTGFLGGLKAADHEAVRRAIALTGIESLAERPVAQMSDGERQRVMITKALATETPVILLDEPTAYLDFPTSAATLLLLRRLAHDEGRAILLSTHELDLALQLADRLWLLSPDGLTEGTPRALAQSGQLAALFATPHLTFNPETLRFEVNITP